MSGIQEEVRRSVDEPRKMYPLPALLPAEIRKRVAALKKLQLRTMRLQADFFQELHRLECRFTSQFAELYGKRSAIVNGRVEPTDEECFLQEGHESPEEATDGDLEEVRSRLSISKELEAGAPGIPRFWLTALKNGRLTADLVCPHDEPILRHLSDVKVSLRESDPMSFTISFIFSPNPFFNNKVLSKEYEMKCEVDDTDPWSFDGPEIVRTKGCTILWQKGMDVTQKTVQKKQRHKNKSGLVRTVMKTVKNDSFFNFFNPPLIDDKADLRTLSLLDLDFEVASFIREKLMPRAVLYFTGEALEDESFSEDSSSSSEASSDRTSLDDPGRGEPKTKK